MDKIALITGASKGIGKELAAVFAQDGYSLLLVARSTSELEQLQNDLKTKYQCFSKILSVDLSNPDSINVIMNVFKDEFGRLDVLVNNAGFGAVAKFTDMSEEELNGMLAVNISTLTKLTYKVLPGMLKRKSGKILNVSSTAAYAPGPYMAVYYASKAYVLRFSEALYEEYKNDGVTVSVLCPGFTKTQFHSRAGTDKVNLSLAMPSMTAEKVAKIAYHGLMKNKRVIVTGVMNKIMVMLMWLTPDFIITKILSKLEKPQERNPNVS
jgi:hypothetical protein